MYVATESWLDDDGDWIEAGKTVVSSRADCYPHVPVAVQEIHLDGLRPISHRLAGRRWNAVGDVTHLLGAEVTISNDHGRHRRRAAVTVGRPYWQLPQREPWRLS